METITIQYDATNQALSGLLDAFLKLDGVKLVRSSRDSKPKRKTLSEKDQILDDLAKGAEQARRLALRKHKSYTADELIEALW